MEKEHKTIFNKDFLEKKIQNNRGDDITKAKKILQKWEITPEQKETSLQGTFLMDIFRDLLGYKVENDSIKEFYLIQESTTNKDSTRADGSLGFFGSKYSKYPNEKDIRVVIELKGPEIDLDKVYSSKNAVDQAFSYQHKNGAKCKWIVLSNFKELRLYHVGSSSQYELFNINELYENHNELKKFLYLLKKDNLIQEKGNSPVDILYNENEENKKEISKLFYNEYKTSRELLLFMLQVCNDKSKKDIIHKLENPKMYEIILIQKAQKILDRLIFIAFCEARTLLPEDAHIKNIIVNSGKSPIKSETKLWDYLKGLFTSIDEGNDSPKINKYNGGLFKKDDVLDKLILKNVVNEEDIKAYFEGFEERCNFYQLNDKQKEELIKSFKLVLKDVIDIENLIKQDTTSTKKPKETTKKSSLPKKLELQQIISFLAENDFSSDIDVNILGRIFESSIPDIEFMKSKYISSEYKQESTQKQDGIYYTPDFITTYIVEKTLNMYLNDVKDQIKLSLFDTELTYKIKIKNKTKQIKLTEWEEYEQQEDEYKTEALRQLNETFYNKYWDTVKNIKIIDPSCGSGAFLNRVFEYLSKNFEDLQTKLNDLKSDETEIISDEESILNIKNLDNYILKNNIFGVDLNEESVNITKLSLWLRTATTREPLANLDDNIKCGNSLIKDKKVTQKAFDWQQEFTQIMQTGGFDVVLGNPPYGATLEKKQKDYIKEHYKTQEYNYDTYKTFWEQGINILKPNGYIGYITPNTYFVLEKGSIKLRKFLFEENTFIHLTEVFGVWSHLKVETTISIYKKALPSQDHKVDVLLIPRGTTLTNTFEEEGTKATFIQDELTEKESYMFNYHATPVKKKLRRKIEEVSVPLGNVLGVNSGVKLYEVGAGKPPQTRKKETFTGYEKKDERWLPFIECGDIEKYLNKWNGQYIKYGKWLAAKRDDKIFFNEKICIKETSNLPIATYDNTKKICSCTVHCITNKDNNSNISLKYVLGLINSKLMSWVFRYDNFQIKDKGMAKVRVVTVQRFPLVIADDQTEVIQLVDQLLTQNQHKYEQIQRLHKFIQNNYYVDKLSTKLEKFYNLNPKQFTDELEKNIKEQNAKPQPKLTLEEKQELQKKFEEDTKQINGLQTEINKLEAKLDHIIYKLYNLNDDDIKIIEQND